MAGTQTGSNNIPLWLLSRGYAARVTILWVMTGLLAVGFIVWGYVDQFCRECELEDRMMAGNAHVRGAVTNGDVNKFSGVGNSCLTVNFAAKGSQELVALPSYPGSGNTWLRHLLEHSTGIYTSSVYTDKKLLSGGFKGEQVDYMDKSVLGVKMHRCSRRELGKFQAVVYLVRNPYNAMISEWHRYHTSAHTAVVDPSTFQNKEWEDFVEEESRHWERMAKNCLKEVPRSLVVFYENLQTNLLVELARIQRFLRIPIDIERLKCTQANAEGNFHRKSSHDLNSIYSREMVKKINQRIDSAEKMLQSYADLRLPEGYRR